MGIGRGRGGYREASMKEVGESEEKKGSQVMQKVHVQIIYFRCVRGMPEISQARNYIQPVQRNVVG